MDELKRASGYYRKIAKERGEEYAFLAAVDDVEKLRAAIVKDRAFLRRAAGVLDKGLKGEGVDAGCDDYPGCCGYCEKRGDPCDEYVLKTEINEHIGAK